MPRNGLAPPDRLEIRPFKPSDRDACLAVFDSNVPDDFRAFERAGFESFLNAPRGPYFVLVDAGTVLGCGGYAVDSHGVASLCWGMIRSDRHGKGLGRMLLRERLRFVAADETLGAARLETSHRAAGFFQKLGFELQEREPDGIDEGLDRCEMRLVLDPSTRAALVAAG